MNWKLLKTAGYGDIVSPLCYAIRNNIDVEFHMDYDESYKYEKDPETIGDRISYISDYLNNDYHVNVIKHYNSDLPYKHDVYNIPAMKPSEVSHNILPKRHNLNTEFADNIVFCPSFVNSDELHPSRKWKDPLTAREWNTLIHYYESTLVDYSTPVDELFNLIEECDVFVGYHGSCAWIARLLQKPMILFSKNHNFTRWAFPWSRIYPKANWLTDIDKDMIYSSKRHEDFYENIYRL